MGLYRVKDGRELGQSGRTYRAGELVSIPDRIAAELRDKVEPCAAPAATARIAALEQVVVEKRAELAAAEAQLATERRLAVPVLPPPAPVTREEDPPAPARKWPWGGEEQ